MTHIVDDLSRQRTAGLPAIPSAQDLESWLNAFQRQSLPLIYSRQGQENLEAWLAAVENAAADA